MKRMADMRIAKRPADAKGIAPRWIGSGFAGLAYGVSRITPSPVAGAVTNMPSLSIAVPPLLKTSF
jgi:hypothetical protein